MCRIGGLAVGDVGVAIDIKVRRQRATAESVFVHRTGGVAGRGRIVDRRDANAHRVVALRPFVVAHEEAKAVGAVGVEVGCVGVAAVGIDRHLALGGCRASAIDRGLAQVGVGVGRQAAAERGVFLCAGVGVGRDRGDIGFGGEVVVDRSDGLIAQRIAQRAGGHGQRVDRTQAQVGRGVDGQCATVSRQHQPGARVGHIKGLHQATRAVE